MAGDPYSASGNADATSRKDAVKEAVKGDAGDVARTAKDSAQGVAETAKAEAANVASEVKSNAKDLLYQARSDLTQQAGTQQQKVANGLRSISDELHQMAQASDQPGVASDLVRQVAERSTSMAAWLDGRDPGSLLNEVKSFARQRPGTFLLLAAGAGVLAGRLSRSLSAGAPESGMTSARRSGEYRSGEYGTRAYGTSDSYSSGPGGYTPSGGAVPPPPVQVPGPATTTAGFDGGAPGTAGQYGAGPYSPGQHGYAGASTTASPLDSPQIAEDPWSGNRLADDPLRNRDLADDPLGTDPLTKDRSTDGQTGRS
jgi:hypothetical protein